MWKKPNKISSNTYQLANKGWLNFVRLRQRKIHKFGEYQGLRCSIAVQHNRNYHSQQYTSYESKHQSSNCIFLLWHSEQYIHVWYFWLCNICNIRNLCQGIQLADYILKLKIEMNRNVKTARAQHKLHQYPQN